MGWEYRYSGGMSRQGEPYPLSVDTAEKLKSRPRFRPECRSLAKVRPIYHSVLQAAVRDRKCGEQKKPVQGVLERHRCCVASRCQCQCTHGQAFAWSSPRQDTECSGRVRSSTKVAVAAKIHTQRLEGETCAQMALNSGLSRLDTWGRERVQPVVSVP